MESEAAMHKIKATKGQGINELHKGLKRIKEYMDRINTAKYDSLEERVEVRRSEIQKLKTSRETIFAEIKERLEMV